MKKLFISMLFMMICAYLVPAAAQNPVTAAAEDTPPAAVTGQVPGSGDDAAGAVEAVDSTYPIGPGDILTISVWKDEALTKDVVVLPDGDISFPLLGLIRAAGKTVGDLKTELEEKIAQYVPEPVLNVEVKQVNSMIIYVIGRVNSIVGRYVLNSRTNVLQALAMAGGLNPYAKRNSIKVFRQEEGKTKIIRFHYDDVVQGKHLEENIELKRGDVVVVP